MSSHIRENKMDMISGDFYPDDSTNIRGDDEGACGAPHGAIATFFQLKEEAAVYVRTRYASEAGGG